MSSEEDIKVWKHKTRRDSHSPQQQGQRILSSGSVKESQQGTSGAGEEEWGTMLRRKRSVSFGGFGW